MRRLLCGAAVVGLAVVVPATLASAHPLGNVTVNTYAGIVVGQSGSSVDYVLDLAELPTVQARQSIDTDGDDAISDAEGAVYRDRQCASLRDGVSLAIDGRPAALGVTSTALTFPPGQAGLSTLRLECSLQTTSTIAGAASVDFTDANLGDRIGWREVTLNGDGVTLAGADVPVASTSARLVAYPEGGSVPRQLSARADARPGGPRYLPAAGPATSNAAQPQARGSDGLTQTLSGIVGGRELGLTAGALALGIALVLGGLHSLAPGHGKTLMAAAVVGRHGTGRQVMAIGSTVAATHTTGVLILGSVLWLTQSLAPDRLLPWLTAASGALLALAGLTLLVRRLTGKGGMTHGHHHHVHQEHDHGKEHDHGHELHGHEHGHDHPHQDHGHEHHEHGHHAHHGDHAHHPAPHDQPSRRWLVTMGMAGGLVPTPSALVVLLGATALGRAWFGVVLVAAYGIGMALTLLGAGLVLVRFQGWIEQRFLERPWWPMLLRVAPMVTAALLVGSGLMIVARGLATA